MLSDDDSNAIGTWITALFDGDGISDELVRYSFPSLGDIFLFCAKLLSLLFDCGGWLFDWVCGFLCDAVHPGL